MQYHSMEKSKQHARPHTQDYCENAAKPEYDPESYPESYSEHYPEHYTMAKVVSVVSYLTLIGWLVAMALYGKHKSDFASFHLRQSLGLIITGALLAFIPLIGWLINIGVCLAWLFALYHAAQGNQQKVPFLGELYQEHLDFIK